MPYKLNPIEIETLTLEALEIHPFSEPVDLYKLVFQALLGPSHIVRDRDALAAMIHKEASAIDKAYHPTIQELGVSFMRVSLSIVSTKTMQDSEMLVDWMLASCLKDLPNTAELYQLWQSYTPVMRRLLPADDQLWNATDDLARKGSTPSHSKLFHHHYDPHYRLVNKHITDYYNYFFGDNK